VKRNPFPGIRSFRTDEADLFFGRESQVVEVLKILTHNRFLALIGSSGSGKSSLVLAGLIPTLLRSQTQLETSEWRVVTFTPGTDPILNLASAIFDRLRRSPETKGLFESSRQVADELRHGPPSLLRLFEKVNKTSPKKWLLIVDQFEEIFRFKIENISPETHEDNLRFVDLLTEYSTASQENYYSVVTMRSDFIDDCTEFRGLNEMINEGAYLVPRMNQEEIRTAIYGPIEINGQLYTPKLVDKVIEDFANNYDQLPVMQHALMRTWDYHANNFQDDVPIDVHHYETVGGMASSLSLHAEEIFNGIPDEGGKRLAEKVFKTLTILGPDNRATRKPTELSKISQVAGVKEHELVEVVERFRGEGNSFIMPPPSVILTSETILDISHESIMRIWRRLREWVEEETKSAELYLRLSNSSKLYHTGQTALWVNPELEVAWNWFQKQQPTQFWAARYDPAFDRVVGFLRTSYSEAQRLEKEREAKRARELRRARTTSVVLGAAALISIALLLIAALLKFQADQSLAIALSQTNEAKQQKQLAEKERQVATSQRKIADQQQAIAEQQEIFTNLEKEFALDQQRLAIIAQRAAQKERDTAVVLGLEARQNLQRALLNERRMRQERDRADSTADVAQEQRAIADRLSQIATSRAVAIKAQQLYEASDENAELARLLALEAYAIHLANGGDHFSPDLYNSLLSVADLQNVTRAGGDGIRTVSFEKAGTYFVSASDEASVQVWDAAGQSVARLEVPGNRRERVMRSVSFGAEGDVVAGTHTGKLYFWNDWRDGQAAALPSDHKDIVTAIEFSRSGQIFIAASADSVASIWVKDGQGFSRVLSTKFPTRFVAADISPSETGFALAGSDGSLILVDPQSQRYSKFVVAPEVPIGAVAFLDDKGLVAVGLHNGRVEIWDYENRRKVSEFIGHSTQVNAIDFATSPEGDRLMATGSYDGTVRLWRRDLPNTEPVVIGTHQNWIYDLEFVEQGAFLVSSSADRTIRRWPVSLPALAGQVRAMVGRTLDEREREKYIGVAAPSQTTGGDNP